MKAQFRFFILILFIINFLQITEELNNDAVIWNYGSYIKLFQQSVNIIYFLMNFIYLDYQTKKLNLV